jgi:hypothetical protein
MVPRRTHDHLPRTHVTPSTHSISHRARQALAPPGAPAPVRLLTVALAVGGLIGGLGNFLLLSGYWPWEMPDLARRFLAGAAAAYVVGGLIALRRPRWMESELLLVTVLLYGLPLVGAILLEADQIDWSRPIAWTFIAVVTPAVIAATAHLSSHRGPAADARSTPLSPALRAYLLTVGSMAAVIGLLVFIFAKEAAPVWPWADLAAWKSLDLRLLASMLLTIGGSAFLAAGRNDQGLADLFLAMLAAYVAVAGAGIALHALATPSFLTPDLVYLAIFAATLTVGLLLRRSQTRVPSKHSSLSPDTL